MRYVPRHRLLSLAMTPLLLTACSGDDGRGDSATTAGGSATSDASTSSAASSSTTDATGGSGSGTDTATTSAGTSSTTAPSTTTETGTTGPITGTTGDPPPCGGCPPNFKCKYDTCIPDLGTCNTNDDCPGDSYCDADGECIPYGVPPDKINDPECVKQDVPEGVMPAIQCEWTGIADPNDKTKGSTLIYTTPIIADLNRGEHGGGVRRGLLRPPRRAHGPDRPRAGGSLATRRTTRSPLGRVMAPASPAW